MPRVCVRGCGLNASAGALELDWEAVGSSFGQATVGTVILGTSEETEGYQGPRGVLRLQYTNTSCQPQLVRFEAFCPELQANMGAGNRWLVALYSIGQLDNAPPNNQFSANESSVFRFNNPVQQSGVQVISLPLAGRPRRMMVPPGRTLHMMSSIWRWIFFQEPNADNRLRLITCRLSFDTTPLR